MSRSPSRFATGSRRALAIAIAAVVVLVGLTLLLLVNNARQSGKRKLVLFCAAGLRAPMERIRKDYESESGVHVEIQYGGSNTLLSQLEISKTADLFLPADDWYLAIAQQKGLIAETIPLAQMVPVIVVPEGNPREVRRIEDLLRPGLRIALGSPDQAAIGRKTKEALTKSGQWEALEKKTTESGVFKPTVSDVANTVLIGSVDAGIVWSATVAQYPQLEAIQSPELVAGKSLIAIGATNWSEHPDEAAKFMQFVGSADRGLPTFKATGYEPVADKTLGE